MLSQLRFGATFGPSSWFTISAIGQDARVSFYGVPASNTLSDTMDLREAYIELFGKRKTGFGMIAGRQAFNLGESRLIGSPQWGNAARTFDTGRIYYSTEKIRLEVLVLSPVKLRTRSCARLRPIARANQPAWQVAGFRPTI